MAASSISDILALGEELRDTARRITGEANEGALLAHCVIARALADPGRAEPDAMRRAVVERARAQRPS
jgi:hypothetical protein